jgi:G:T-mismatch repair DNA endonuclease (very short patch repair protein)
LRKLDGVIMELEARGLKFRLHTSLRVGYTADVLFKKEKIIILDTRNADSFAVKKLSAAGYKVFVIPEGKLDEDLIRAFCDEVEKEVKG